MNTLPSTSRFRPPIGRWAGLLLPCVILLVSTGAWAKKTNRFSPQKWRHAVATRATGFIAKTAAATTGRSILWEGAVLLHAKALVAASKQTSTSPNTLEKSVKRMMLLKEQIVQHRISDSIFRGGPSLLGDRLTNAASDLDWASFASSYEATRTMSPYANQPGAFESVHH